MTTDQQRLDANARQFDRIAARYDALGFLTRAALALAETVRVPTGGRVLDVATGTGTVALALASQAAEVVGTDIAPAMLQQARARAVGCPNVQFVSAEATALPFADQSFDAVVCGAGLFFVPDMPAALREWRRVLRPGGEVVFSAFGRGLLGPLPGLWRETLAGEGIKPGAPPPWAASERSRPRATCWSRRVFREVPPSCSFCPTPCPHPPSAGRTLPPDSRACPLPTSPRSSG